jgi:hypothetical protein
VNAQVNHADALQTQVARAGSSRASASGRLASPISSPPAVRGAASLGGSHRCPAPGQATPHPPVGSQFDPRWVAAGSPRGWGRDQIFWIDFAFAGSAQKPYSARR